MESLGDEGLLAMEGCLDSQHHEMQQLSRVGRTWSSAVKSKVLLRDTMQAALHYVIQIRCNGSIHVDGGYLGLVGRRRRQSCLLIMAVDDKTPETKVNAVPSERTNTPNSSPSPATLPTPVSETHTPVPPSTEDRSLLLSRARSFLRSPQIANQDVFAKRQFLREKGFHEPEIDSLLRDAVGGCFSENRTRTKALIQPPSAPVVPPRTYPQPPPSNLPNLLLGLSRVFSWLAGGSALLVFVYYVGRPLHGDAT